ncbi:MAG: hypothetical protein RBS16_04395 [Candidatus Cloacimonadales bacterium]|jgi:predicted transcriptional regulator|nr:hypothetical protein [Candidatus Cloacimonadales bacterium]
MEGLKTKAVDVANAIKDNLLKPMYNGLKKDNQEVKETIIAELQKMNEKIEEVQKDQQELINALLNVKWDD